MLNEERNDSDYSELVIYIRPLCRYTKSNCGYKITESWLSGRKRFTANEVGCKSSQGFESLTLRHDLYPKKWTQIFKKHCFLLLKLTINKQKNENNIYRTTNQETQKESVCF